MKHHLGPLCSLALAAALLAGCSSAKPSQGQADVNGSAGQTAEEPGQTSDDPSADEEPAGKDPAADDATSTTKSGKVASDEAVKATMTANALSADQLQKMNDFGYFNRAVSVEACEKDGSTWWVVVADHRDDADETRWVRSAFLTDALNMDDYGAGTWIELLGSSPWKSVDWSDDLLVRGQSALEVGKDALSDVAWAR